MTASEIKTLYDELRLYEEMLNRILNEPRDPHNSSSHNVSPNGIKQYNRLAKRFNLLFENATMSLFSEETTPNVVTHPKPQEIHYEIRFALSIITAELGEETTTHTQNNSARSKNGINKKVFIVHGHDNEAKETVARFLERSSLEPIILHEQIDGGRTIIEKIERYTDVAYAIVLYTPCDLGRDKDDTNEKSRARQNVIFEHGYLIGKLGRSRVCALVKHDVEIPSDVAGVAYVKMDAAGAWKERIKDEIRHLDIV